MAIAMRWRQATFPTPVPTPAPGPAPEPPPAGFPTQEPVLTTKAADVEMDLPAHLTPTAIPGYETKVVRLIPSGTWNYRVRHSYSIRQAWNHDESALILTFSGSGSYPLFDGQTLELLGAGPEVQLWSTVDPQAYYNITGGNGFRKRVLPQTTVFTTTIAGYTAIHHGGGESVQSWDDRYFAMLGDPGGGNADVFVFDAVEREVVSSHRYTGLSYRNQVNNATMSPDGDYVIVGIAISQQNRYHELRRASDMSLVGTFQDGRLSHQCVQRRTTGEQCFVTADLDNNLSSWLLEDTQSATRASKRIEVPASSFANAHHVSGANYRRPGYVYVSTMPDGYEPNKPMHRELYALKLDGTGTIERYGQNMALSNATAYGQEPHLSVSPTGDRVIWATNWYGEIAGNVGHAFVAGIEPIRSS